LLVAACLRAAITSVGPLLDSIGASLKLSDSALGVLGALPLVAFAGLSVLVYPLARRLGTDRTVLLALVVLAAATVLRSLPVPGVLWAGTLLIGAGVAVGNVLVPAVVKRDYPRHVPVMTGAYSATMNAFAAVASGLVVPLAAVVAGGWRVALGISAVLVIVAIVVWAGRMRRMGAVDPPVPRRPRTGASKPAHAARSVARSPLAWQVTLNMGLQSTVFYILVNWLPSLEVSQGLSAGSAGIHLLVYQAVGIPSGLFVTAIMARLLDQRVVTVLATVPILVGMVGFLLQPSLLIVWVILAGLTNGCSISIALSLMGLRARTSSSAARLSGMAQSLGYLMAAGGPTIAGWLHGTFHGWTPVIFFIIALTLGQAVFAYFAGRNRYVDDQLEPAVAG
jgi:CP family cyanate transporter-like MFS transporter